MSISYRERSGHALQSEEHFLRSLTRRSSRATTAGRATTASCALALSSLALLGGSALAQEAAAPQAQPLEEIQVTGSRIARTGFTTPVPVTSMEMDELRMLEPSNTIAEQLEMLPQFRFNSTAQRGGHAVVSAGRSELNLRGVGPNRTLVLLDGARVVPSDRGSSVNVDYLPSALMRRVEVVTGGASAAYGADALAGVTNFILDREFTGVSARAGAGITQMGDGQNWQGEVAFGAPLTDRLHVIGSFEGRKINDFQRGERPARADSIAFERENWGWVSNPDWDPNDPPGTNPRRIPAPHVHSASTSPSGIINQPGFALHRHTFNWDATATREYQIGAFPGLGNSHSGGAEYHMSRLASPTGQSRNLVKQRSGFLGFNFDATDDVSVWGHGIVGQIESTSPGDLTLSGRSGLWYKTMYRENPFLPESVQQAMDEEGRTQIRIDSASAWGCANPRQDCDSKHHIGLHSMWSGTMGVNWNLPGGWTARGSYQYGESKNDAMLRNWLRIDRYFLALDTIDDPEMGRICAIQRHARDFEDLEGELHAWAQENMRVLRLDAGRDPDGNPIPVDYPISVDSVDGTIRDCVPINPLGVGNVSPEAWRYVHDDKDVLSTVDQHFAEVMATGVIHQGFGAGEIYQAVGATYRSESIAQGTPPDQMAIDALGPPMNVSLPHPETGEMVPVIRGIPGGFPGGTPNLHQFSTYPTFAGSFDVWEVFSETIVPLYTSPGGERRVELNVAARFANYSRAGEVWTYKTGVDFQVTNDVRLRGTYSHDVREGSFSEMFDYQATGVNVSDPAFEDETYLSTQFAVGNPDVEPEAADTFVVGLVYQPSQVAGLQLSADYYDIDMTSSIGRLGAQRIVEECYFNDIYCELIDRNPDDGRVGRVRNVTLNIDRARLRGADFEVSYRMQPNLFNGLTESLTIRGLAGYLRENSTTPLDGETLDQVGFGSTSRWTATGTINYNLGRVGINVTNRWNTRTTLNRNWEAGVDAPWNHNPSQVLTNLGLSYTHDMTNASLSGSFNITNLFDRHPPILAGGGRNYDQIGRRYNASLRFRY